jgi:glycine/D-amino acid oxidase-like deaminating enzyme
MTRKIKLLPQNDQSCGWINNLEPRRAFPILDRDNKADWTIIGGGYTGLAFARRMAELRPQAKIIVIDACAIGEGASARNSGFAIANSSSGGAFDPTKLEQFNRVNRVNSAGIELLRKSVEAHNIECQWRDIGKLNCGAEPSTHKEADHLIDWLNASNTEYKDFSGADLASRLGTSYYTRGIWTKGDVMLQPAALVRGLSRSLPENVDLYEHSPITEISERGGKVHLQSSAGRIVTDQLMIATNAFLHVTTPKPSHTVPLTLTASLSRPLSELEQAAIGNPDDWGILSLHGMGATLRYTYDRRILIRNTAAYKANAHHSDDEMQLAVKQHVECLRQRFPSLPDLSFESSWQGVLCISRNSSSLFGKLSERIVAAGCYNASGISKGSAFGHALAEYVEGCDSDLINDIGKYPKPTWMPPRPVLDIAMKSVVWGRKLNLGLDQ